MPAAKQFVLLVGCALVTWALSHAYRLAAKPVRLVAVPNHRSAHQQATPTGAGIVFALVTLIAASWLATTGALHTHTPGGGITSPWFLAPLALVLALGFLDDCKPLPWLLRIAVHLAAGGWLVWLTGFPSLSVAGIEVEAGMAGYLFGALALAWMLNLYNFMDGIDGLAAAQAVFAITAAAFLGYWMTGMAPSLLLLLSLSACLGFLVINWPQARVFMGDAGSGFLGLLFGYFILTETAVNLWAWLILLGWFITDACLTLVVRLFRGEPILQAHNLHAYQHIARRLGTPRTLALTLMVNCAWLLPWACLAARTRTDGWYLLICAFVPVLFFQYLAGAGQTQPPWRALQAAKAFQTKKEVDLH